MANRPLPGISFQVPSASVDEGLPRMDIAAFAGFAERGPLHTPVPVEDVSAFRDLFGKDPLLAREAGGAVLRGFLGSAVEGFFANGGRRAWIVRVASTEAEESRFVLSSLVGVDHREATVRAPMPGWSNGDVCSDT